MTAPSERSRIRRAPDRGRYDAESIHAVLDAGALAHVGIVVDGAPVVIPMLYGRDGDTVYLHGSVASRLLRTLATGVEACLEVTHVDALVVARSAFHHSMNYRSVVVHGTAELVEHDEAKLHGLRVITDHLIPGRWEECRAPSRVEMRQTSVLRMAIGESSAKARTHGVVDDDEDLARPVWAGLVPVVTSYGSPVADPGLAASVPLAPSVAALVAR
ncbi:MAG: pyridoxamine 5'-phosphate oxidase family protein [Acidimicrobiales bacterium]